MTLDYITWWGNGEPPNLHQPLPQIVNAAETPEILLFDIIGPSEFGFISPRDVAQALKEIGPVDALTVRINSPGGSIYDGMAIYNLLKNHRAHITVEIDGLAASIASVIAQAGDTIRIAENALMMTHLPAVIMFGTADDLRKGADVLDTMKDQIADVHAARSGRPAAEFLALMEAETWFSGAEAVEAGMATEISENKQVTNAFDLSHFKNAPKPGEQSILKVHRPGQEQDNNAAYRARMRRQNKRASQVRLDQSEGAA